VTLLSLIEDYGYSLEKRGIEYWMKCPFHEGDTDPSFSISPTEKGYVWYCFGCKRGGGAIKFIAFHDHISTKEARRKWDKLNGKVVDKSPNVLDDILLYLQEEAKKSDKFKDYLNDRHVSKETAEVFRLGYCNDFQDLCTMFGIGGSDLKELGLWDMSNSVIFPFEDIDGVFKFHGRKIDSKDYMTQTGKTWRNSLWGLSFLKEDIVYVVEGYHDVLVGYEKGYSCVAMSGTTMHSEFWQELRERNIKKVIFMPDGDNAGYDFLNRLLKSGFPRDFYVSYIHLKFGDPDECFLSDKKLPPEQVPLEWYVNWKWNGVYSLSEKINMYKDISTFFVRMPRYEKEVMIPWFREKYGDEALSYLYIDIQPDFHAEEIVLGNCLHSDSIRSETYKVLSEDCFHINVYKNLFIFIRDQENVTYTLVKDVFKRDFDVDLINYKYYINKVKDIRSREKLYDLLDKVKNEEYDDPAEIVGNLVEKLYKISENNVNVFDSASIAKRVIMDLNQKVNDPKVIGISLSNRFPVLNRVLLGYIPDKFILLSGCTGHGKTTVACNLTDDLIFDKNQKVLWCTLEMTPEEIIEKQLVIRSGIAGTKLMVGSLEQSEYNEISKIAHDFLKNNLRIVHRVYDLYKLVSIIRSQIMKYNIRVIFIDYVQLISVNNKRERWEQLMEISNVLKKRVCSMGVTVIALSQLSKAALKSDIPLASDQAGSYGMLADADVAITVKKKIGREISEGSNFLFYIDKHRYGHDCILIDAVFDKAVLKIRELNV
jgi:replicative DNA helicase